MNAHLFAGGVAGALLLAVDFGVYGIGVIPGGGAVTPSNFGAAIGGTEVDSTSVTFFDVTSMEWKATLSSKVYSGDLSNPLGGLTFAYLLSNDDANNFSLPTLGALELAFGPMPGLDVGYLSPGGETPDAASMPNALLLRWGWVPGIGEGQFSATLIVYSPALRYDVGTARVTGGGSYADNIQILGPVPEPATFTALFALGLAGFAAYRRIRA